MPVYTDRSVNAKLWLMSIGEIMGQTPTANNGGGVAWDAWKERTGLTNPSNSANAGRSMKDEQGNDVYWWLRSFDSTSFVWYVHADGVCGDSFPSNTRRVVPALFIPKDTSGGSNDDFTEPDLSQPLDEAQLENLQKIVAAGKASEYLNTGDELLVSYGTYTMPFEVVGFEPVEVEGGETVPAINLLAKYTNETDSQWGASGSTKYSASTLRSTIIGSGYQGKIDSDFLECLAETKVQTYSRDGSTDVVYDKLFAPSMAQLGVTDTAYNNAQQAAVEGPAFTAYQGADNAKRVKQAINATGTAQYYWTRSLYSGSSGFFGLVRTSGAPSGYDSTGSRRVVAACNFIGRTDS